MNKLFLTLSLFLGLSSSCLLAQESSGNGTTTIVPTTTSSINTLTLVTYPIGSSNNPVTVNEYTAFLNTYYAKSYAELSFIESFYPQEYADKYAVYSNPYFCGDHNDYPESPAMNDPFSMANRHKISITDDNNNFLLSYHDMMSTRRPIINWNYSDHVDPQNSYRINYVYSYTALPGQGNTIITCEIGESAANFFNNTWRNSAAYQSWAQNNNTSSNP